jgi:HSP20 family protein
MKERFMFDIGRIFDEMFSAAEDFKHTFKNSFPGCGGEGTHGFHWDENVDFYPLYSYPPANVYLTKDKELNFEFALAGFEEKNIDLQFQGDYMILQAKVSIQDQQQDVQYFKRRLKFKDIVDQKYYVPENKFDREKVKAVFKNGILQVKIPAKEGYAAKDGVKIEIVKEGE